MMANGTIGAVYENWNPNVFDVIAIDVNDNVSTYAVSIRKVIPDVGTITNWT